MPPFGLVPGRLARLIEQRRVVAQSQPETGDTLVEILISLVVIGLTVTAILGAFVTTISASAEQRNLAKADAFLRSFVNTATYDISLSSTPLFVACATTVPATYSSITPAHAAQGFTASIIGISAPPSGCSSSTPSTQQLTAKVTSAGASDSTTFVVYPPAGTVAAIATSVTKLSPSTGLAAGGTSVTISGSGFSNVQSVKFGTVAATSYSVVDSSTISATSPAGTGTVDVTISTSSGTSPTNPLDQFTYAPTVTAISPSTGGTGGGTSVTITGTGFIGASSVMFGTIAATSYTVASASSITAVSPAGSAGAVDITVTTIAGTSSTNTVDKFTYGTVVSGISPSSGPASGGTVVSLLGSGFTGVTAVRFGSTPATTFTVNSDTSITATSPAGTGTVDITVTTPGGTSPTSVNDRFTYNPGSAVGLGMVLQTGTHKPVVACAAGTGTKCSSPNSTTCMMTSSSATTCDISGIWQGSTSSATFFLETVDANGNPVSYSASNALTLGVTNGSPSSISIAAGKSSTSPNVVTVQLSSNNSSVSVAITGGGWAFTVVVSS